MSYLKRLDTDHQPFLARAWMDLSLEEQLGVGFENIEMWLKGETL